MSNNTHTTLLNSQLQADNNAQQLTVEFFYRGRRYPVNVAKLPFMIGRDASSCDLLIDGPMISRHHCSVEIRDGQLGILDRSTNGTMVKLGRVDSVFVRNEFCPLVGQGYMKLGEALNLDDPQLLMFKVALREA